MKLLKKYIITGQLEAVTGLVIGGTNAGMEIGGVDKHVIRNPITNEPYIPGSSIKGKMRSLLELRDGTIGNKRMGAVKNGPNDDLNKCRSTRLFGNAVGNPNEQQRPSRILVRDAFLSTEQGDDDRRVSKEMFFERTDLPYTEVKTEVVIDRITSRAMPRQIERVPSGAKFDLEFILNIYQGENEKELLEDMFSAMQLLQNDYLGAAGSRGSGQIRFLNHTIRITKRTMDYYKEQNVSESDVTDKFTNLFPK